MPMIDVYARTGTFRDTHMLARDLATAVMTVEGVPDIPMFRENTAAFVHDLPATSISNVNGDSTYVRVQVLTNAGALDRDKQLAVVAQISSIVADAAGDASLADCTWVLLTEAPEGGWGLHGHASTNAESSRRRGHRSPSSGQPLRRAETGSIAATATGSPAAFATSNPAFATPGLQAVAMNRYPKPRTVSIAAERSPSFRRSDLTRASMTLLPPA